jgi:hypothetical protein
MRIFAKVAFGSDIKVLNLSTLVESVLRKNNINTIGKLIKYLPRELLDIKGMSYAYVEHVREGLRQYKLDLKEDKVSPKADFRALGYYEDGAFDKVIEGFFKFKNIKTIGDILKLTVADAYRYPGIGISRLKEIDDRLEKYGKKYGYDWKLKDRADQAALVKGAAEVEGGIDLSQQGSALHVVKDANGGVVVDVDPVLIARVEREGMSEVDPVIVSMRPADVQSLFGVPVLSNTP